MDGGGSRDAMRWPARRRSNTEFYEPVSNGYANELSPCPIGMPGLSANILLLFFFQSFYSYFSQMEMRERNEENVLLAQRDLQLGDIRIGVSVYGSRESECVRNATDG